MSQFTKEETPMDNNYKKILDLINNKCLFHLLDWKN